MKKLFRRNEIVRKRFTLQYGKVTAQLGRDEYYCSFDNEIVLMTEDELSYGVFKQLFKWLRYMDNLSSEKMFELIEKALDEKKELIVKIKRLLFASFYIWILIILYQIFKQL